MSTTYRSIGTSFLLPSVSPMATKYSSEKSASLHDSLAAAEGTLIPTRTTQRKTRQQKRSFLYRCSAVLGFIAVFVVLRSSLFQFPSQLDNVKGKRKSPITVEDLEWIQLKGKGSVSLGFLTKLKPRQVKQQQQRRGDYDKSSSPMSSSPFDVFYAQHKNETFIAKMGYRNRHLSKNQKEIQLFDILNKAPSIPNIPVMVLGIPQMKNPFRNQQQHLEQVLKVEPDVSRTLAKAGKASLLVMEYLQDHHTPKNPKELTVYMHSLLSTLEFAHSRNVINGDLNEQNIYFNVHTQTVKLFDWNEGWLFRLDRPTPMFYRGIYSKMPPEGWIDEYSDVINQTAVHATVSSFDVWSTGLLLKKLLNKMSEYRKGKDYGLLESLRDEMFTIDPYQRPSTTQLLQHEIFLSIGGKEEEETM